MITKLVLIAEIEHPDSIGAQEALDAYRERANNIDEWWPSDVPDEAEGVHICLYRANTGSVSTCTGLDVFNAECRVMEDDIRED